jgi:hypothetical protein
MSLPDLIRVKSNLGHVLSRRLGKAFNSGAAAVGTANPNTLNGNLPRIQDAMGMTKGSGVVTFATDAASQIYTIFYWSSKVNAATPSQGWVLLGANSAEYTKTVDQYAAASFTVPENTPIFIMAGTSAATNCWMGGCQKFEGNQVADL